VHVRQVLTQEDGGDRAEVVVVFDNKFKKAVAEICDKTEDSGDDVDGELEKAGGVSDFGKMLGKMQLE
jgi:hypothetical protein